MVTNSARNVSSAAPIFYSALSDSPISIFLLSNDLFPPFALRSPHRLAMLNAYRTPRGLFVLPDLHLCKFLARAEGHFPIGLHTIVRSAKYRYQIHAFYHLSTRLHTGDHLAT